MALEFGVSSEGRDSSVQIFDKFLSSRAAMDMNPQLDLNFVSYSAAASLSLGSKIHDGKRGLSLVRIEHNLRVEAADDYPYLATISCFLRILHNQFSTLCRPVSKILTSNS